MNNKTKINIVEGNAYLEGIKIELDDVIFIEEIGDGGNARVLRANDVILNRDIAVKIYIPKKNDKRDKLIQGKNEARKVASLKHKNIVITHGAKIHSDKVFTITSEYLDGVTLKRYLEGGIAIEERLEIWHKISRAMVYSHKAKIYHGDLHVKNIMMVNHEPIIIDFGTSAFVTDREKTGVREAEMLRELVQKIFPEIEGQLLVDEDEASKFVPEMALNQCIKAVDINECLYNMEIYINKKNSLQIRNELFGIAIAIARCPAIPKERLLHLILQHGLPDSYIKEFIDKAIVISKLELFGDDGEGVKSDYSDKDSIESLSSKLVEVANSLKERQMHIYKTDSKKFINNLL